MSRDRPPPADAVSSPPPSSTPSRLRNNYADEAAPIASAKRPTRRHKPATPMDITPRAAAREDEWSPMHRVRAVPRNSHATAAVDLNDELAGEQSAPLEPTEDVGQDSWVGRKVDALFSPVLSFLNGDGSADPAASEDTVSSVRGAFDDHATGNDEEGRTAAVSIAIRAALLEASKELEPDDIITTDSNLDCKDSATDDEGFDAVPVMTKTDSTNGDLVMTRGTGRSTDSRYHDGPSDNHCIHDDDDDSDYKGHTQLHQEYEEDVDEEEEFNPFLFIKSLPPYQYAVPPGWIMRSKALPPPSHDDPPICLVLDLDETLVHCTVEPIRNADMVFPVEFNGVEYTVHVRCRPFLTDFLEKVSRDFEVVVFTASQQVYADKLLDKIDPGESVMMMTAVDLCSVNLSIPSSF